jgi:DNA-binding transcriptional ArsR family regulator
MTQPALSQHLAVLRRAGLVRQRRQGRRQIYTFRPEPLRAVHDWIARYDQFWTGKLENLGRYLDKEHKP